MKSYSKIFKLIALDGLLAFAVVFAFIWGLTQIAIFRSDKQEMLERNTDGVILLNPYSASLTGNLDMQPRTLENQTSDFEYYYGWHLVDERNSRHIEKWNDAEAALNWKFMVEDPGDAELWLNYSSELPNSGFIVISCYQQEFRVEIDSTGKADNWSSILIGKLHFDKASDYQLELKAESIKQDYLLNLKSLELRFDQDATSKLVLN